VHHLHASVAALLVASSELMAAIGQRNELAFYAALTAVWVCFLPSVIQWLNPPAQPPPPAMPA
jgi:hypothetical protein